MTEEIKEMLHCIEMNCKHNKCFGGVKLDEEDCKLLLDYITNLQQENKAKTIQIETLNEILNYENIRNDKLQQENSELTKENEILKELNICVGCENNPDYKSRCKKAVQYIMTELITEWDIKNDGCVSGSDLPADAIIPILNILNGSDENER